MQAPYLFLEVDNPSFPVPGPVPGSPAGLGGVRWRGGGAGRRMRPVGLLDRLRWADSDGRLGCSGLALAGLVVALVVEDACVWGSGFVPVRYRRLVSESGYSRSTVARRLPAVLALLAAVGVVEYGRRPGEAYRVRLVAGFDVLQRWGVAWVPWPLADASHRLHPRGWSQTDRTRAAAWWNFANWEGDINGVVDVEGLATRVGLRPSTLGRDPAAKGLWSDPKKRLEVGVWADAGLDVHRRAARYDDYRRAVPARSGREGASVRWHGHVPEPSSIHDGSAEHHSGADLKALWGGLIDGSPVPIDTTPMPLASSGARPRSRGERIKEHNLAKGPAAEESGSARRRTRHTPDRWRYEKATASGSWAGPTPECVTHLARRFGWHIAQAALETHRAMRLDRPVHSAKGLATHFATCFAHPQSCSRRHRGPCGRRRLDQHRARRLDEDQQQIIAANTTPARNTAGVAPGGRRIAPGLSDVEDRPADPVATLAKSAKDASPRLGALAARLVERLDVAMADHTARGAVR